MAIIKVTRMLRVLRAFEHYLSICLYIYLSIYIYIYRERER